MTQVDHTAVPQGIPMLRHMVWVPADHGRWVVPVLDLVLVGLVPADFRVGSVQGGMDPNLVVPVDLGFMARAGN